MPLSFLINSKVIQICPNQFLVVGTIATSFMAHLPFFLQKVWWPRHFIFLSVFEIKEKGIRRHLPDASGVAQAGPGRLPHLLPPRVAAAVVAALATAPPPTPAATGPARG